MSRKIRRFCVLPCCSDFGSFCLWEVFKILSTLWSVTDTTDRNLHRGWCGNDLLSYTTTDLPKDSPRESSILTHHLSKVINRTKALCNLGVFGLNWGITTFLLCAGTYWSLWSNSSASMCPYRQMFWVFDWVKKQKGLLTTTVQAFFTHLAVKFQVPSREKSLESCLLQA